MNSTGSVFPVLADIEDILELLVPVFFVIIYVIGNAVKAMSQKNAQARERKKQEERSLLAHGAGQVPVPPPLKTPDRSPPTGGTVKRLPYAKAVPESKPRQTVPSIFQRMEELKQQRIEQLRRQQLEMEKMTAPPARSPAPSTQRIGRPSIPKVQAAAARIPIARPAEQVVPAASKKKTTVVSATLSSGTNKALEFQKMLRDPRQIRNAVVAAEILGKPLSLR